jgi:hypothetical protein
MSKEQLQETLLRYFRGCNNADFELFKTALDENVTLYFIDFPPLSGRDNVAEFFKSYYEMAKPRWTMDRVIFGDQEMVVEWSALYTPPGESGEKIDRGVDWLICKNNLVVEAHQYHRPQILPPDQRYELMGFPYRDRNYPCPDNFDSKLP